MSFEGFSSKQKLDRILQWSKKNPKFNTSFVNSLQESLQTFDSLTDSQEKAVNNILKKFRISSDSIAPPEPQDLPFNSPF